MSWAIVKYVENGESLPITAATVEGVLKNLTIIANL